MWENLSASLTFMWNVSGSFCLTSRYRFLLQVLLDCFQKSKRILHQFLHFTRDFYAMYLNIFKILNHVLRIKMGGVPLKLKWESKVSLYIFYRKITVQNKHMKSVIYIFFFFNKMYVYKLHLTYFFVKYVKT